LPSFVSSCRCSRPTVTRRALNYQQ
jgi:hypothetical protein